MAKYHNIGSMKTKKDRDADGNVQYYIEIDKDYLGRISIDGKPLVDKYIDVERPTAKYDRMLKAGKIKEDEYDQKTAMYAPEGKAAFVKFDLQMKTKD